MSGLAVNFAGCVWMRAVRKEKVADSKITRFVWIGPHRNLSCSYVHFATQGYCTICMSCFCLFCDTNFKSVSFRIVVIMVFELSLQSIIKVVVKLQAPWTSNMNFD